MGTFRNRATKGLIEQKACKGLTKGSKGSWEKIGHKQDMKYLLEQCAMKIKGAIYGPCIVSLMPQTFHEKYCEQSTND